MKQKIVDLHQDISLGLFAFGNNFGRKNEKEVSHIANQPFQLINQTDLPRLKMGNIRIVVGASCPLIVKDGKIQTPSNFIREFKKHNRVYKNLENIKSILIIKSLSDLNRCIKEHKTGIILSIEGLYGNGITIKAIKKILACGITMAAPFWSINNQLGCGCMTKHDRGLTPKGKKIINFLEKNNIIIDLAHSSKKTFLDVLKITTKPILVSHTASWNIHKHPRNINQKQAELLASKRGLIGISLVNEFIGSNSISAFIEHIKFFKKIGLINNIGIGSDFCGMFSTHTIKALEDSESLTKLPVILKDNGFNEIEIEKILWKNSINFFRSNLMTNNFDGRHLNL